MKRDDVASNFKSASTFKTTKDVEHVELRESDSDSDSEDESESDTLRPRKCFSDSDSEDDL